MFIVASVSVTATVLVEEEDLMWYPSGVVTMYTAGATWNKPAGYQPTDLFVIVCVNGGQGGGKAGNGVPGGTGRGGLNGGWVGLEITYSALAASYVMTIGAAGAAATGAAAAAGQRGGNGGATTFGALVTGVAGQAYIKRQTGLYQPMSYLAPGDGGDGEVGGSGTTVSMQTQATPGGGNAFVAGGFPGTGTLVPTAGSAAPTGIPCGGSGGGGGSQTGGASPTVGGVGGAPGGGGGGGGVGIGAPTLANGAAGAAGAIYVIAPY